MKIIIGIVLFIIGILIFCDLSSMTKTVVMKKGDKEVIFIGVPHLGISKYWEKIQEDLDSCDIVVYEGVPEEAGLSRVMIPFYKMAAHTKTIFQTECLEYEDHWILSDVTFSELMEYYTESELKELYDSADLLGKFPYPIARLLFGIGSFTAYHFDDDPLIHRRNKKPAEKAIQLSQKYDRVGILYGNSHKGIIDILKSSGYGITKTKYRHPFR